MIKSFELTKIRITPIDSFCPKMMFCAPNECIVENNGIKQERWVFISNDGDVHFFPIERSMGFICQSNKFFPFKNVDKVERILYIPVCNAIYTPSGKLIFRSKTGNMAYENVAYKDLKEFLISEDIKEKYFDPFCLRHELNRVSIKNIHMKANGKTCGVINASFMSIGDVIVNHKKIERDNLIFAARILNSEQLMFVGTKIDTISTLNGNGFYGCCEAMREKTFEILSNQKNVIDLSKAKLCVTIDTVC